MCDILTGGRLLDRWREGPEGVQEVLYGLREGFADGGKGLAALRGDVVDAREVIDGMREGFADGGRVLAEMRGGFADERRKHAEMRVYRRGWVSNISLVR